MLALLLVVALAIRLAPLLQHAVWGADTGEYLAVTEAIVSTGSPPADYAGWGLAYPDFPGMEILVAQVSLATGIDPLPVLQLLVPALNVLVVAATFLIGRRLFDRRSGLWAAGVVAVAMPTVFTGSHPMPESLAHGLALLVAYLALDAGDPRRFAAATVLGLGVVVTHHLTTYFLILALVALWAARVLSERTSAWPRLGLVAAVGLPTVAYWLLAADAFRDRILAVNVPLAVVAALPIAGLALLALVAWLRPRIDRVVDLQAVPRSRNLRLGAATILAALVIAALLTIVPVPGTNVTPDPGTLLWYLPMLVAAGLAPVGAGLARGLDDGLWLTIWPGLLGASLVVGAVAWPTVLIPYRHVPFLAVPAALLVGAGIADLEPDLEGWKRALPVAGLVLLAATAYPPPDAIGGFDEGVSAAEMDAVRWADDHLTAGTPVLADHRMSSLLFGVAGLSASWDSGEAAWFAPNWSSARPHLAEAELPNGTRRVEYVVVTPATRAGVALHPWRQTRPLDGDALAKFDREPFVPVYDRGGVRIYRIAWGTVNGSSPAAAGPSGR